ncbi:hypothetical protein AMTR_s00116p00086490 [Amborella trichopoda]|uniref:Uncharacterized protein n=1 Tax=Amborella trichopoda TaxID=13333 RepID=W1NSI7_AMBTC|nr:hypothetical protein AMTR_s00116p00086490 [Amborella trichopoda]
MLRCTGTPVHQGAALPTAARQQPKAPTLPSSWCVRLAKHSLRPPERSGKVPRQLTDAPRECTASRGPNKSPPPSEPDVHIEGLAKNSWTRLSYSQSIASFSQLTSTSSNRLVLLTLAQYSSG